MYIYVNMDMLNSGNSTICLTICLLSTSTLPKLYEGVIFLVGWLCVCQTTWFGSKRCLSSFIILYPSFAWCGWWVVDSWTPRPPFVQKKGPSWSRPPDSSQSLLLKSPTNSNMFSHSCWWRIIPHVGVHVLMILNHWWIDSYQQFLLYQATTWPRNWASGIRCKNS